MEKMTKNAFKLLTVSQSCPFKPHFTFELPSQNDRILEVKGINDTL